MNRGLQYFVFLVAWLFILPASDMSGQGREGDRDGKGLPPVLRGQEGNIGDLDSAYCESSPNPEIYVNDEDYPDGDYESVEWVLYYYNNEGDKVFRNDLLIPIGTEPENGVELDIPQIVSDGLLNEFLVLEYSFNRGLGSFGGDFDYTIIRKDPEVFNLTIDQSEVCSGEGATLTLEGTESDYLYYLYRNDNLQNTIGRTGDGDPIQWNVSPSVGTYSYYVLAEVDDDDVSCETQMSGEPTLTVHPLPNVTASTSTPEICEGETIYLEG
ncbi:MAG: hypothetical protein ACOC2M_04120, partial [bacterium]